MWGFKPQQMQPGQGFLPDFNLALRSLQKQKEGMNPFLDFCCPLLAFFIFNEVTHAVLTGSLCLPLEKVECASLHCCLV